jgi:PAS domain S-box-containing protein
MPTAKHYLERELYDAIRRDSEFFDCLHVGTLDGIWYWDLEKPDHEWLSPRFWDLLGFDPAEMPHLAKAWQDLMHPDDLEAARENLARHLADPDHPYDQVVRYRHKNGSCVWLRCRGVAIRDGNGRPIRMIGAHTDVSELKRTVEDLLLQTQELEAVNSRFSEVARAKDALQAETEFLRDHVTREHGFSEIVGRSDVMLATLQKVEQAAKTDATVLVLGETGTGKELLAHALHARSNRASRPLVSIDCTTLPSALVESELFGHEKGAFTGAHETKVGRFELADGGTVFLDEIGELSLDLQAKLLRVLQEGEFRRLGSKKQRKVDVRIIAATNRELKEEVREGRFRSDLYYRLSVFPLESPPLRERREDIPLLASYFLSRFRTTVGKRIDSIAQSSVDALLAYDWPGNVRELQNVIERSAILCTGDTLTVGEALGDVVVRDRGSASALKRDLRGVEAAKIRRALEESGWKVKGEGNAASRLGLKPSTLRSRMKKLGIARP